MVYLTRAQRIALFRKWSQDQNTMSYRDFRRTVQQGYDCVMVHWCGMWLGIEPDGYTHA